MKVTVWHLFQTLIEDLQISTGNKYETEIERKAAFSLYFEKKYFMSELKNISLLRALKGTQKDTNLNLISRLSRKFIFFRGMNDSKG